MLAVLIAGLCAEGAAAADLLGVYRDAIAFDAQFASARSLAAAGQESRIQGRAGLLPQIGASATVQYNDSDIKRPLPGYSGRYGSNQWGVQLTQPLFRMQNWYQYEQGNLASTVSELQFETARQDLLLRIAGAYFDQLNAQETLASIVAQKAATLQQLELAKKSFEVGTTTITDVHEAQSRYDLVVANEAAASANVEIKRETLRRYTGKDYDALAPLREGVHFDSPQPADMAQWTQHAEEDNFGVQAAKLAAEIAGKTLSSSRAGHLPTADIVASYGATKQNAIGGLAATESKITSGSIGVQLSLPIFAGGYTQSKVRESLALRDKARSDYEDARRAASLGVRQAYLGVTSGIAQVAGYEAALLSSRSAVEANKLGYQVGVRINIDVLNAETQFFDTFRQLSRARYDTLLAQLQLKSATGTLGEPDIQAINGLLDPEAAGRPITLPDTTPKTEPGNKKSAADALTGRKKK
jgi:outer membrane protein